MLQKKRFGNDRAGTAGGHGSDRRDDQMSHQDEPIPHAANDDGAWRKLQGYQPIANCGRLAIRRGQVAQFEIAFSFLLATSQSRACGHLSIGGNLAIDPPYTQRNSANSRLCKAASRDTQAQR